MSTTQTSALCRHSHEAIHYQEQNLVEELLGHRSFTEVLFEQVLLGIFGAARAGRGPTTEPPRDT